MAKHGIDALADLELATLDADTGEAPAERLKDMRSAHDLYNSLRNDDHQSALNRASIRAMFDGEPPFDEADLAAANQADRCNLNFDEAGAILDKAQAGYVDLLNSVPTYITVKTDFGDENEREEWNGAIAEEFTNMVKAWPEYSHRFLLLSSYWLQDGVSFAAFDHSYDWRFNSAKFGDFIIPRRTMASEENIQVAFWIREYETHQLHSFIRNPEAAKKLGWDVEEVQKAIIDASAAGSTDSMSGGSRGDDWESWQENAKNNDLGASTTGAPVKVVNAFIQEFDGSVSHYIFRENGEGGDFLFKRKSRFENIHQCMVGFTYGQGTNGYYHGIRGLGWRIFSIIQELNIARCQWLDGAKLSSSMLIQPASPQDLEKLSLTYFGPYAVLAPGFKAVEKTTPNFGQNIVPAIGELTRLVNDKVGQFSSANVFSDNRDRTRYEVEASVQQASELSVTSLSLFYEPMDRLFREMFRRVQRKNYPKTAKGGAEVAKFRAKLEARGVPLEALFNIDQDSVKVTRAVGGGSAASRQVALRELTDLSPAFDVVGRQRLMRDRVAAKVGYDNVDRYIAPPEVERVDINEQLAALENNDLIEGHTVEIRPNDPHMLHLPVHLKKLSEYVASVEEDGAPLEDVAQPMSLVHGHAVAHLEQIQADPMIREDVAYYREALQQVGEIIVRAMLRLEKLQRDAQAQAEAGAQEGAPVESNEKDVEHQAGLRRKLEEHQVKLDMMRKETDAKINLEMQRSQARSAIADAEAASRIRRPKF